MLFITRSMAVVAAMLLTACGAEESIDAETNGWVFYNMLTGKECAPDDTFTPRADHGGETAQGVPTTSPDEDRFGGDDNQYMGGSSSGAGGQGGQGGERTYHSDDFPQPGCDAQGCCAIDAADVDLVRNRHRIRCRCRARCRGDCDPTSLPDCCADLGEEPEYPPAEEDPDPPAEEDPDPPSDGDPV